MLGDLLVGIQIEEFLLLGLEHPLKTPESFLHVVFSFVKILLHFTERVKIWRLKCLCAVLIEES